MHEHDKITESEIIRSQDTDPCIFTTDYGVPLRIPRKYAVVVMLTHETLVFKKKGVLGLEFCLPITINIYKNEKMHNV